METENEFAKLKCLRFNFPLSWSSFMPSMFILASIILKNKYSNKMQRSVRQATDPLAAGIQWLVLIYRHEPQLANVQFFNSVRLCALEMALFLLFCVTKM